MKNLVVKFDIDTVSCMGSSLDNVVSIADEMDAKFTFFVNLGRAISYRAKYSHRSKAVHPEVAEKLSALTKLGARGLLNTLIFNPYVGLRRVDKLRKMDAKGHELALHGGKNHGEWHHNAHLWQRDRLKKELQWGIEAFESVGLGHPKGFSSPGWNSPDDLPEMLTDLGFSYMADIHSYMPEGLLKPHGGGIRLKNYCTSFTGEPGGVGSFETAYASGVSPETFAERVLALINAQGTVMVYDHPSFAGGVGFSYFSHVLKCLKDSNVNFVSISGLSEHQRE